MRSAGLSWTLLRRAIGCRRLSPREPVAERRVTSVLFGDLVGFTPLSESKDAEEVRELLSAYFAQCRVIVGATAVWSRSSSAMR